MSGDHGLLTPGVHRTAGAVDDAALVGAMLRVEVAWLRALACVGAAHEEDADALEEAARGWRVDLVELGAETEAAGNPVVPLVRGLRAVVGDARLAHLVHRGLTSQDVLDTALVLLARDALSRTREDLGTTAHGLASLAAEHRDTVMAGRTHGQPGSPITFGFKVASWADEVRRHLDRLREARDRWCVGQLAGAVGALAFFGADGPELRRRFCAEVGLADPGISWLTARDRIAEFGGVLAMVCGTLARIGVEV